MDLAISQINNLVETLIYDYRLERKRIGVWIKEGNYLDSEVQISLEDGLIDYEVFIYLNKATKEQLNKKEKFVYLHELSHIIILEEMKREKGIECVQKYIDKYNEDVKQIGDKAREQKWNTDKIQMEYEKIEFENETNLLTEKLIKKYDHIAS